MGDRERISVSVLHFCYSPSLCPSYAWGIVIGLFDMEKRGQITDVFSRTGKPMRDNMVNSAKNGRPSHGEVIGKSDTNWRKE